MKVIYPVYDYMCHTKHLPIKVIMSLSLVILLKGFFAFKVNIYLQNTSIKSIYYACPTLRTTCTMALMLTLQHDFELSTLPSIPFNGHIGGLC
jgi:hypothetical protein